MGVPKRGTDHCIMKSSFASQLPSGANRHLLSLSSYFPSSLVRVLATMALICFRRSLVAVLFVMVVACSSVTAVSAVKPLKLTSRSDFGILEPENLVNRHAEVWLCPYAYSSVPIEPTNPSLVQLLGNLTQLINSQFNYTQYGMFTHLPLFKLFEKMLIFCNVSKCSISDPHWTISRRKCCHDL